MENYCLCIFVFPMSILNLLISFLLNTWHLFVYSTFICVLIIYVVRRAYVRVVGVRPFVCILHCLPGNLSFILLLKLSHLIIFFKVQRKSNCIFMLYICCFHFIRIYRMSYGLRAIVALETKLFSSSLLLNIL